MEVSYETVLAPTVNSILYSILHTCPSSPIVNALEMQMCIFGAKQVVHVLIILNDYSVSADKHIQLTKIQHLSSCMPNLLQNTSSLELQALIVPKHCYRYKRLVVIMVPSRPALSSDRKVVFDIDGFHFTEFGFVFVQVRIFFQNEGEQKLQNDHLWIVNRLRRSCDWNGRLLFSVHSI